MVLNATFNTISVISWRSVLLVEEIGGPGVHGQVGLYVLLVIFTFINVLEEVAIIFRSK